MSFIALRHTLDVYTPGEQVEDMFGNLQHDTGEWAQVRVASWWVDKSEEKGDDSILRTIDYLHAHLPPEVAPGPGGRVRTPDGRVWNVVGNPENYEHGFHGWSPGLAVIHAKEVAG